MCFRISLLLCFLFLPLSAYAGGVEDVCAHLKDSQKPPTWGPDYVPGVDVYDHQVTSADLSSGGSNILPDPIMIPVEIDLLSRFGLTLPADIELKPELFRVYIFFRPIADSISYSRSINFLTEGQ